MLLFKKACLINQISPQKAKEHNIEMTYEKL